MGGPLCFPFHLVAMRKSFLLVQNILFLFVDYFLLIEEKHDLSALNLFPLHLVFKCAVQALPQKKEEEKTNIPHSTKQTDNKFQMCKSRDASFNQLDWLPVV